MYKREVDRQAALTKIAEELERLQRQAADAGEECATTMEYKALAGSDTRLELCA